MKLTISNIAWPDKDDAEILSCLPKYGVEAIEIAPTRIWPDWTIDTSATAAYLDELSGYGLQCSSLQAIVYNRPQLRLFGSADERAALVDHLKFVADIAASLGAGPVVFGAPKNRRKGERADAEAREKAIFFDR